MASLYNNGNLVQIVYCIVSQIVPCSESVHLVSITRDLNIKNKNLFHVKEGAVMGDKILLLLEGVRALDGGYCNPGGD